MKKEFFTGMAAGVIFAAIAGTWGYRLWKNYYIGENSILSDAGHVEKIRVIEDLIDRYYLYEVDEEAVAESVYTGLVSGLGDPYSRYYTAEEYESETVSSSGSYVGIGVVLQKNEDGSVVFLEIYRGGNAEQAGICAGDVILTMDGEDVTEMEIQDIVSAIRVEGREDVVFEIQREEERLTISVPVSDVQIPSVFGEMLENNIGYLEITEFKGVTYDQYLEACEMLEEQGMEGLIVDLRGNPGGYLDVVCDILREILPEGVIVYAEDKYGNREEELCDGDNAIDIPLMVLIDENSASASEIFSGAVQDYGVGTLVGSTTFGKGIVQSIRGFTDGSALKLTISHYYTPNGNDIHQIGITPDVVMEDDPQTEEDETLDKAMELMTEQLQN